MRKLVLFIIVTLFFNEINAQTISLTSATPTSTTNGSISSVRMGTFAGNGTLLTGGSNCYVGYSSGRYATSSQANSFFGSYSGSSISTGSSNTFIGASSGNINNGNNNTFLGYASGSMMYGNGNVLIGSNVGLGSVKFGELTFDNKLAIDNSNTTFPLIWGDFATDQLNLNGKVGIGGNSTTGFGAFPTTAGSVNVSTYNLFVKGGILTEEVRVSLANTWADYVFKKDYNLKPLNEVEIFIKDNGHLPNVPSAQTVCENGIELGEMAKIQQEKIEELTLYIIEQNKINQSQAKEIEEMKAQIKILLEKK